MSTQKNFRHTVYACYISYVTQAAASNFLPLLFVMFNTNYGISLEKLGLLVALNFCTQITVDLLAAKYAASLGYRRLIISSGIFAALGFVCLGILPRLLPSAYLGMCISVFLCAVGGGLSEALISPILEFCPLENKSGEMSLLHSFYCWGCVLVILLSTVFFGIFGTDCWWIVSLGWASIPMLGASLFAFVPMPDIPTDSKASPIASLLKNKLFWIFALLMLGAGASEVAIAQWSSAFAEAGLGVSKTVGDIAGPCAFAILMGISRVIHARIGHKFSLKKYIAVCALSCTLGYLLAALAPHPVLSLIGCGICGFSVGVMWPGIFSCSSQSLPMGGTALFALLALAGDLGASVGPSAIGFISKTFDNDLSIGILFSTVFPVLVIIGLVLLRINKKKAE